MSNEALQQEEATTPRPDREVPAQETTKAVRWCIVHESSALAGDERCSEGAYLFVAAERAALRRGHRAKFPASCRIVAAALHLFPQEADV